MVRSAVLLAFLAAGCAAAQPARVAGAGRRSCAAGATLQSRAGRQWWDEQRWRFASDAAAEAAWRVLADNPAPSPWPDWYRPYETLLPPGTRFQMAIGGGQTPDQPGS